MFVLDGKTGEYLKANILESWGVQNVTADTTLEVSKNTLNFVNMQSMNEVVEISFSISYNPEVTVLNTLNLLLDSWDITEISNYPGISTYLVSFNIPKNIDINTQVAALWFEKLQEKTAHINLINVNFSDANWEQFLLSSSGTMF